MGKGLVMYIYQDCTLSEVKAYRSMQSDDFDFGSGLIKNEGCGEEAYYKMHIQMMEEVLPQEASLEGEYWNKPLLYAAHEDLSYDGEDERYSEHCYKHLPE